jgi:WD40 repeat protein
VIRGEGLLRKIRFPFMSALFLLEEACSLFPENSRLEGLALEAGVLKSVPFDLWAGRQLRYLDAKALVPRRGRGVKWTEYAGGGERRLAAGQWAYSVSAHGRSFVCGGLHDGSIRVWNRATLEVERTLTGHTASVWALVSVEGWLISGSNDRGIRVWDVATGSCERTLEGHTDEVRCLAVGGNRLVSGSWDGTAKVWRMEGAVSAWRCERTLAGHEGEVCCVVTWGGKVASGSGDKTIRVWDVQAGAHEQTLVGHEGPVFALVACGPQRLISSSMDKTVRVWSMATWACVQTVRAYAAGSAQYIVSLAVSGSTLVGGSFSDPSATEEYEARVWDLETLEPLHALRQAAGQYVTGLASDGGEVWGAVGRDVVVWGRPAAGTRMNLAARLEKTRVFSLARFCIPGRRGGAA